MHVSCFSSIFPHFPSLSSFPCSRLCVFVILRVHSLASSFFDEFTLLRVHSAQNNQKILGYYNGSIVLGITQTIDIYTCIVTFDIKQSACQSGIRLSTWFFGRCRVDTIMKKVEELAETNFLLASAAVEKVKLPSAIDERFTYLEKQARK